MFCIFCEMGYEENFRLWPFVCGRLSDLATVVQYDDALSAHILKQRPAMSFQSFTNGRKIAPQIVRGQEMIGIENAGNFSIEGQ